MSRPETKKEMLASEWNFPLDLTIDSNWKTKGSSDCKFIELHSASVGSPAFGEFENVKNLMKQMDGVKGYQITKAFAVENETLKKGFQSRFEVLKKRLEEDPNIFNEKKWKEQSQANWRSWIMEHLDEFLDNFVLSQNGSQEMKVVPLFHVVKKEETAWKIFETGFANLSILDDGYFGKGM